MASLSKRSWILQDFVAHDASVNCLALGHKSGRVLVTGGDDKKVNLWAVGKHSCFMSLSGHTTPISAVQFNQPEELVCAGSFTGALKVWDLEAARLIRTLNGHRDAIKTIDFHPYLDFLVSGSEDNSIKTWDSRKKTAINTFNGHKSAVNSVKFSPDGLWIASGGEDGLVKIWDTRICRVLKQFDDHLNSVTSVEFHPHEFLLATGSLDRSVNFFDLENFNLVSSEKDLGPVRCLCFNPDGECLFTGVKDLKVIGWEPSRLHDVVPMNWGKVCDISIAQNQLIGASFHLTNVQIFVVDLKKVQPLGPSTVVATLDNSNRSSSPGSPFAHNQNVRKSFSKAERPISLRNRTLDVKTIEESTSGTDPEEDATADITNVKDYNEIFKGRGLSRTPPPDPEPFTEPITFQEPEKDYSDPTEPQILGEITTDCFEALSLDNNVHNYRNSPRNSPPTNLSPTQYSRSKSNLDQVYLSRVSKQQDRENILPNINKTKPTQRFPLQRQNSCKDVPEKLPKTNSIKHSVSEANINKGSMSSRTSARKNSFSKPRRNSSSVPNVSKIPQVNGTSRTIEKSSFNSPVDIYVKTKISPDESPSEENEFVPVSVDKPVGLDLDDFLPKNHAILGYQQHMPNMSDAEVLNVVLVGHEPMLGILKTRQRSLQIILAQYRNKDLKTAIEIGNSTGDNGVLIDILGVINSKSTLWNLDVCVVVLPKLQDILQSKYETYITTACNTLKLILKHFGPVIKNNVQSPVGSFGVDISREERFEKSQRCYDHLRNLKQIVGKKQTLPGVGSVFREVFTLFQATLD